MRTFFFFLLQIFYFHSYYRWMILLERMRHISPLMERMQLLLLLLHLLKSSFARLLILHNLEEVRHWSGLPATARAPLFSGLIKKNTQNLTLSNPKHMFPYKNYFFSELIPLFWAQGENQMSPKTKRTCPHHKSIVENTSELLNNKIPEMVTKTKYGHASVFLSLCAYRFFSINKNVNDKKKSMSLIEEMCSLLNF